MPEVSVAVLAGGVSRRMGKDKALLPLKGRAVIEWVLERVVTLSDDVSLITNEPEKYCHLSFRIIEDIYPGKGSLGGIYTAIHAAHYPYCLVVACDMPFLNTDLLRYLVDSVSGFDVVVPRIVQFPETTHAVYGRGCLEPIRRRLLDDRLKIIGFFDDVEVRYLEREDVARFDPTFRSFLNMNTPDDWERAQRIAEEDSP